MEGLAKMPVSQIPEEFFRLIEEWSAKVGLGESHGYEMSSRL